jgi:hypothetical protein
MCGIAGLSETKQPISETLFRQMRDQMTHRGPDDTSIYLDAERGVGVYGKGGYYDFPTVAFYRGLFKLMWPVFKHYPPLIYSYVTAYGLRPFTPIAPLRKTLKVFFPHIQLADPRWSLLDTFDSVTPSFQSAHESYEVFEWFKSAGLIEVEPSPWGFTAYHGRKPDIDAASSAFESRTGSLVQEPSA